MTSVWRGITTVPFFDLNRDIRQMWGVTRHDPGTNLRHRACKAGDIPAQWHLKIVEEGFVQLLEGAF